MCDMCPAPMVYTYEEWVKRVTIPELEAILVNKKKSERERVEKELREKRERLFQLEAETTKLRMELENAQPLFDGKTVGNPEGR